MRHPKILKEDSIMGKPKSEKGEINIIGKQLIQIRAKLGLSQRGFASFLQLHGLDWDKSVITRIETNKRYVRDFELKALTQILNISYEELLDDNISDTN